MKRSFIIFPILLFCLSANAQIIWEKTWGGPWDDAAEVRNTQDGGMIVMASIGGLDSWIMKIDANGDTIWTNHITQPYDLAAITETPDGGFLATGTTRTNHRDWLAWKFDSHGDSVWMRIYVDSLYIEGMYTVLSRADNSFLMTGYTSANGYDMLAMHIDSVGNVLWRKVYGGPSFEAGAMPSPTSDGGYVFATTASNFSSSHIWVVRIDSLGDTVWTRHIVNPASTGGAVPTVASDGKIWVIGWIEHGQDYDNHVFCLDSLGSLEWTKTYGGIGFESRSARGIIEDIRGGFTFTSSVDVGYGPGQADFDVALFRLDSVGNVVRIHRIGHAGDEMPRYFEQAANSEYLITGYSTSFVPQGQQTWLARWSAATCGEYFYDLASPLRNSVCPGDTLLLDAGAGFASYLWSDGNTNRIRSVVQSDTLWVLAVDSAGCPNYSNAIAVLAPQAPSFTWLTNGLTVDFDDTLGGATQFVWHFGDGDSAVVEDPTHIYNVSGQYLVCLRYFIPNCGWRMVCDTVVVTSVGLLGGNGYAVELFPNPAQDVVQLRNQSSGEVAFEIFDLAGKRQFSGMLGGKENQVLDLRGTPAGMYLCKWFCADKEVQVLKFLIAR